MIVFTNSIKKTSAFVATRCCFYAAMLLLALTALQKAKAQTILIDGKAGGKRFDGIGAVSGGGATSVLLKDYPVQQRNQVLDLLFKPKFGAAISALLVEVPGDGNSTQGSEPSHMRSASDENYFRGYEWWLMKEAKKRNPRITLDANAWSAPRWIGNNQFWSQDMCNYYANWIKGMKNVHGITLDAIGCRNEKGVSYDFVKKFRATLNANGLGHVKIHAFDNWPKDKFDFVKDLKTDTALRNAIDIISAHTMSEIPTPANVIQLSKELNKPIWNSEEHIYKDGFDCAISIVEAFNKNFIESYATKIVNWYLVGSTYSIEPFAEQPPMLIAREPWSGHYYTREALWGYAHYGQFTEAGWEYVNGACGKLDKGGTYITMKSPGNDYSMIIETKGADRQQKILITPTGGLSTGSLCVWRSNANAQFERLADIVPVNGTFEITLDTASIYSLSTTRGQQKGSFKNIPSSKPFPFPYYETFEEYNKPERFGYLPSYTADIAGVFEIADRSDKKGKCLRQVINETPQAWAPEWMPYTILGNSEWTDYEVAADVFIETNGTAGIMGRVNATGQGYGCQPNAYYMTISSQGDCDLYLVTQDRKQKPKLLASAKPGTKANEWYKMKLRFTGSSIQAFIDDKQVLQAVDTSFAKGMAGIMTLDENPKRTTAQFDNIVINAVGSTMPKARTLSKDLKTGIYR
jgi:galactosylceramidase